MGAAGSGSGETNPDNSCRQCPSRTLFPTPNQHILRRPRHLPPIPSRAPPIDVTRSRLRKQNSTRSSHTIPWPGSVAEGGMSPEEQGGGMGLDEFESDTWILRIGRVVGWVGLWETTDSAIAAVEELSAVGSARTTFKEPHCQLLPSIVSSPRSWITRECARRTLR